MKSEFMRHVYRIIEEDPDMDDLVSEITTAGSIATRPMPMATEPTNVDDEEKILRIMRERGVNRREAIAILGGS
jgi:hypothetical protein